MQFSPSAASVMRGFITRYLIAASCPAAAHPALSYVLGLVQDALPDEHKLTFPSYLPKPEPQSPLSLIGAIDLAREVRENVLSYLRAEHEQEAPPEILTVAGFKAVALSLTLLMEVGRYMADENGGPGAPEVDVADLTPFVWHYALNVAAGFGLEQAAGTYGLGMLLSVGAEGPTQPLGEQLRGALAVFATDPAAEPWLCLGWGLPRYFAAPLAPPARPAPAAAPAPAEPVAEPEPPAEPAPKRRTAGRPKRKRTAKPKK